ncbi:hypothetical protein M3Y98_00817700 [Aphelenchoides besseyi]|nr:hypothetical protein M3Y98_00817700 [Aphelenchoides besseyi]KAI6212188.1 hypothetical protein M3Y96_00513900 [Aphelenchoides besseyi]
MDFVAEESATTNVPDTNARPERVNGFNASLNGHGDSELSMSRSSSAARIRASERSALTELTSDDVFRMKDLRSESKEASEVADVSAISVIEGNGGDEEDDNDFASEQNAIGSPNQENPLFDPDAGRNEASELNEEDIFRMKSLSMSRNGALSEQAGQSAVSLVDSASNFEEHIDGTQADDTTSVVDRLDDVDVENATDGEKDYFKGLPQTDLTFSGQFVFNRNRRETPNLNKDTVIQLDYPFEPLGTPPTGISNDAYLQMFRQSKVYAVGTAHFSVESQNDVRQAIAEVQPDLIFVELCQSRMAILSLDEEVLLREARSLNREKIMSLIRDHGIIQGLLQVMLLSTSAHITRQLKMAPGGEFRAAHRASFNVQGCRVILGDRPIQITLQRALSSLGFFQRIRLCVHILLTNFSPVTQEDVERCKDKDLLETLLDEMAGEFPQLSEIFVKERDQYMTHVLHEIMQSYTTNKILAWTNVRKSVDYQPLNIVAVVGIGHLKGIQENWSRHINQNALLEIPKPSRVSQVFKFAIKVAVIGGVSYGCYRAGHFAFVKISDLIQK